MNKKLDKEYIKSVIDLCDSENISDETKQLAVINYSFLSALSILEKINKNLEKIANNTEKVKIEQNTTPVFSIGEYFDVKTNEYEGFETIICKKNKESHVDKNIILD